MKNQRFFMITTLLLLLLNAGTLLFLFFSRSAPEHRPPGNPAEYIVERLKLNARQQEQFRLLRDEHQDLLRDIRDEDKRLHDSYFDLLKSHPEDKRVADSITSLIAVQRKAIDMSLFDHFNKLRGICTAEQKQKLDGLIDDIARRITPGPPPEHPGPRR